jgi:signal transduction histidine kinase
LSGSLSLRARLLLTYILLLTITIGIISAAFILFLNTRAAPPQQTYQRLASVIQGIPLGEIIVQAELMTLVDPMAGRAAVLQAQLDALAEDRNLRILVVDPRDATVYYDTAETVPTGETLALQPERYNIPNAIRRGFSARVETVFGSFTDTSGEWYFAGLVVTGPRANLSGAILFADPPDNQSLQEALADFGSALLLPLIQSSIIGLIVALILAVIGSRSIARPLQHLASASERVAEGDYEQRVPVEGPSEVRAVAVAFNNMTEQVQRTRLAQQDFLANVSHDLKTPLTSIRGYSQAIMDGAATNPVQAAHIIYDEAGRMNRMVTELTDLARLQAGRMSMEMVELDLSQIANAISERLAIVAREKGVRLDVRKVPVPPVRGDGDRLAQVIMNLISNAIKYTPSGGRILVETRPGQGGVEVSVQDNGIGIPVDELPRIFERFYQVDKARGPERGTGLGLAIAHEIAIAHEGRLTVTSAGVGYGATFTLWLPLAHISVGKIKS